MAGELVRLASRRRDRRLVVTFPLRAAAREQLAASLGGDVQVIDVKASDGSEDIVLVPSASRQLIGKIRTAFPSAAVLVVELEDDEHGVRLGGQAMRSLDAGADGYFVARSLDELATVIERAIAHQESQEEMEVAALQAPSEDELHRVLDELVRRRQGAELDGT